MFDNLPPLQSLWEGHGGEEGVVPSLCHLLQIVCGKHVDRYRWQSVVSEFTEMTPNFESEVYVFLMHKTLPDVSSVFTDIDTRCSPTYWLKIWRGSLSAALPTAPHRLPQRHWNGWVKYKE